MEKVIKEMCRVYCKYAWAEQIQESWDRQGIQWGKCSTDFQDFIWGKALQKVGNNYKFIVTLLSGLCR